MGFNPVEWSEDRLIALKAAALLEGDTVLHFNKPCGDSYKGEAQIAEWLLREEQIEWNGIERYVTELAPWGVAKLLSLEDLVIVRSDRFWKGAVV